MLDHTITREQVNSHLSGKIEMASQANQSGMKKIYGRWNPKIGTVTFYVDSSAGSDYVTGSLDDAIEEYNKRTN